MGCKCKEKVVKKIKKVIDETNLTISDIMTKIYGSKK